VKSKILIFHLVCSHPLHFVDENGVSVANQPELEVYILCEYCGMVDEVLVVVWCLTKSLWIL
jgi:hypothetical protein